MLHAIARLALATPRRIIGIALLVMVVSAIVGIPVTKNLSPGGFRDQTAESWRAAQVLSGKFGQGDMRLIVAVASDAGVHSQAADAAAAQLVAYLASFPFVTGVKSAWTMPPAAAQQLISRDGKTGLVVAGISGGESGAQKHAKTITDRLPALTGVTVTVGGDAVGNLQMIDQTKKDLLVMEAISLPLCFLSPGLGFR